MEREILVIILGLKLRVHLQSMLCVFEELLAKMNVWDEDLQCVTLLAQSSPLWACVAVLVDQEFRLGSHIVLALQPTVTTSMFSPLGIILLVCPGLSGDWKKLIEYYSLKQVFSEYYSFFCVVDCITQRHWQQILT